MPASETEKYIDKISEQEERYDFYIENCSWKKAADIALKLKDLSRASEVCVCVLCGVCVLWVGESRIY